MSSKRWIAREFWTVFNYGDSLTICSKHRSQPAAIRAARLCEKQGGAAHRILSVQEVGR